MSRIPVFIRPPTPENEEIEKKTLLTYLDGRHIHVAGCSTGRQTYNGLGELFGRSLNIPFKKHLQHSAFAQVSMRKGNTEGFLFPDDPTSAIAASDGFIPKEEPCYQACIDCKNTVFNCQVELCRCRAKRGFSVSTLKGEDGFEMFMSYSWKEHMLDVTEPWLQTPWETLNLSRPDVAIINSGIHSLHGLDPAWYYDSRAPNNGFREFRNESVTQFFKNASKLLNTMTHESRRSCVLWHTMNDFGRYAPDYVKKH